MNINRNAPDAALDALLAEIRACRICEAHLPLGVRPVLQAGAGARLMIVGQAPGTRVHATGIPFNDPSGDRLRRWLGIGKEVFYDPRRIAPGAGRDSAIRARGAAATCRRGPNARRPGRPGCARRCRASP
jgi:uracil-DNA glycosylase